MQAYKILRSGINYICVHQYLQSGTAELAGTNVNCPSVTALQGMQSIANQC